MQKHLDSEAKRQMQAETFIRKILEQEKSRIKEHEKTVDKMKNKTIIYNKPE